PRAGSAALRKDAAVLQRVSSLVDELTKTKPQQALRLQAGRLIYSPVKNPYCSSVSGTTLNRPCRTRGESANIFFYLTSANEPGRASSSPALIFTCGFLTSLASTDTTVAVPTALFTSLVS